MVTEFGVSVRTSFGHFLGGLGPVLGAMLFIAGCDCSATVEGDPCERDDQCANGFCAEGFCRPAACAGGRCPDASGEPGCEDSDGDGRGPGCSRGPDCDDQDPFQIGTELCGDERDNDCDGEIDEAPPGLCGCDTTCSAIVAGSGGGAFDPSTDPSEGVGLTPEGWIQLDSTQINTHIIWIANTQQGTVSKVDTRTFVELGRYRTGPSGGGDFFSGEDPSRTSVNTFSDVYVGNRAGRSLTKVSALGTECPDTNGDGMITTSSGAADVLPWGMDDCVLWRTELPDGGILRAVAAQDVEGPDFDLEPFVWVGGWDGTVWKLDGETGAVVLTTESPVAPYGFAIDGVGNLWISSRRSGFRHGLGRIDTTRCFDDASCDVVLCGDEGDDCIKQQITWSPNMYGITVDSKQRVWLGGDEAYRYDPSAPAGSRWTTMSIGQTFGIAADARGFVYAARMGNAVVQVVADDPTSTSVLTDSAGFSSRGVAIDFDGKVWGINRDQNNATVIDPTDTLGNVTVTADVAPGLVRPYTYSDMTGAQLRLATNPRGYYRRTYEGCAPPSETTWQQLSWEAEVPPGTSLVWRARSADSREELEAAAWVVVGEVPPDAPPADLAAAFALAGITAGALLEVEVQLVRERESTTEAITPKVKSFEVSWSCGEVVR